MRLTYNDLVAAEDSLNLVRHALRRLMSESKAADFEKVIFIMQEVRHAGLTLCDPHAEEIHHHALRRLQEIFETEDVE